MPSTQQCLIRLIMMMENIDNDDGNTLIRLIMMMEILDKIDNDDGNT